MALTIHELYLNTYSSDHDTEHLALFGQFYLIRLRDKYTCASFGIDAPREKRSDISRFLGGRIIDTVDEASRADKRDGAIARRSPCVLSARYGTERWRAINRRRLIT